MPRIHIAIRRESYVAGTVSRPEVGVFTQTHATRPPVPWGQIAIGEPVYMKWASGPIVASATVQGIRQFREADAATLQRAVAGSGLYDLAAYWTALPPRFFAVAVYLEDEQWLDPPLVPAARSYGESWIVCASEDRAEAWLTHGPARAGERRGASPRTERGSRTIPASLRFAVFRRDGFTCIYCGRRAPQVRLHADHVVPWIQGGRTTLDNLRTACTDCNLGKGARPL